jgi:hypothetical protein
MSEFSLIKCMQVLVGEGEGEGTRGKGGEARPTGHRDIELCWFFVAHDVVLHEVSCPEASCWPLLVFPAGHEKGRTGLVAFEALWCASSPGGKTNDAGTPMGLISLEGGVPGQQATKGEELGEHWGR